jgi:uncharacterized protein YndB with AHSA1/START domain
MATSKVTPDADAIVTEIHIAAPPERVFQALVDPQQVLKWWGQQGVYRSTEFHRDLRPAGKWRAVGIAADGHSFEASGEYVEVDPPHLLVYSWVASWTGDAKTTVLWELHPVSKGTLVRLHHYGLAAYPDLAKSYSGWPRMLGWLQALLERGETIDDRKPSAG